MTMASFQAALAEMVASGSAVGGDGYQVSALEQRRLEALRADRGVPVMRTLYFSWRLTKVLSLLPLTTGVIGTERLAQSLLRFWAEKRSTSLYFVDECAAFLCHLEATLEDPGPGFADAVAFERARLELRKPCPDGRLPAPVRVRLRGSPAALLSAPAADALPEALAAVVLEGCIDENGRERWTMVEPGPEAGVTFSWEG
jgi:hypothetical protein